MEKELIRFISENKLSPFESAGKLRRKDKSIFMTKDARDTFTRTLEKLGSKFVFSDTENLFNFFSFTNDSGEIKNRQEFFKTLETRDNKFLKELVKPKAWWKPKYGILAVSEDEKTFQELQKLNVPCQFLNSQYDLEGLEGYDIIHVIDCDQFQNALERLEQAVFLDSLDQVYLERYLEILSGWQKNLGILGKNNTNENIKKIVDELMPLIALLDSKQVKKINREEVEASLAKINNEVEQEISKLSISGTALVSMLSKGQLSPELLGIVESAIKKSGIPEELFKTGIPVSIDEDELEKLAKKQDSSEFSEIAENVKKNSKELLKIPEKLQKLSDLLIFFDFASGISQAISGNSCFPETATEFFFSEAENIFLDDAQPVSFNLNDKERCSILTGANSGGKTTLLEHIIQLATFFQLGLPVRGRVSMPVFSEIYYFAKNKGSASKGAFETLLTQMAQIKPGNKTLILADEIEAVTEPGVAGRIISATAEYFIGKGCFLIIATHLGQEIQKNPPVCSRIDGIEAKGLDENFELIVDHNPVLGKLASSTPELIVEKMANLNKEEYFQFLSQRIKKK